MKNLKCLIPIIIILWIISIVISYHVGALFESLANSFEAITYSDQIDSNEKDESIYIAGSGRVGRQSL